MDTEKGKELKTFFFVKRERDSTKQLIGSVEEVVKVLDELCEGTIEWKEATDRLPEYSGTQDAD